MAIDCLNEIISVFLERKVHELSDREISNAVESKGNACSVTEVQRIVQSLGSSLFRLQANKDGEFLIRVEPTIIICHDFLSGKCHLKTTGCNQLHLCRQFGHCITKDCRFPHDFTRGTNFRIVKEANCENVDPLLLVRLIRFTKSTVRSRKNTAATHVIQPVKNMKPLITKVEPVQEISKRRRGARGRRATRAGMHSDVFAQDDSVCAASSSSTIDIDRQLDVSFPSEAIVNQFTIEKIESFLNLHGVCAQKKVGPKENEHFRQWTLHVSTDKAVADLLARPVIPFGTVNLKFKRSKPTVDRKSFLLRSIIDPNKGAIIPEKWASYVDDLIDRRSRNITDLSSPCEQIILVQSDQVIDFNVLRRVQKSRRQLEDRDVFLTQVYQIETAKLECIRVPLSAEIVKRILEPVHQDIFSFTILSDRNALVEFIHTDGLKQWLAIDNVIKQMFVVNIKPAVEYVNEKDISSISLGASRASDNSQSTKSKSANTSAPVVVYIGQKKAMIAAHPTFSIEYKELIRTQLGCKIDIHGNRIKIQCDTIVNSLENQQFSSLLSNETNNFMQKFEFHTIFLQQPTEQLNVLRANSATVAFRCVKDNTYMLATKKPNMQYLIEKLSVEKPPSIVQLNQSFHDNLSKKPPIYQTMVTSNVQPTIELMDKRRMSTLSIPSPLSNSISTEDTPSAIDEIVTKSVTLPIDNPAQATLFTEKIFVNRLRTYFESAYHVQINIECTNTIKGSPIAHIIGRQSAFNKALEELLNLLSLFRTQTFDETTDGSWTKMRDAIRVIQHHLSLANVTCVCQQQASPISVKVHYIDKTHAQLGVDEQVIVAVCRKKLVLLTCNDHSLNKSEKEWITLETKIYQRAEYGKDICLFKEQHKTYLFGLPQLVKNLHRQFELINTKYQQTEHLPTSTNNQRSDHTIFTRPQLNAQQNLYGNERHSGNASSLQYCGMNTLPDRPKKLSDGTSYEVARPCSITFDVDEPGFEVMVSQEFSRLLAIVNSKCLVETQIINCQIQIQIPRAKVSDFDNSAVQDQLQEAVEQEVSDAQCQPSTKPEGNWFLQMFGWKPASAQPSTNIQQRSPVLQARSTSSSNSATTVNISNSKITVCIGDLTKQAVDAIVVCSTSRILCDAIISAAGPQVKTLCDGHYVNSTLTYTTLGGHLPCKHILFLPCTADKSYPENLKQSIDTFVASAFTYALSHNWTTLVFPSVGCGKLGFAPKLIAEYMIGETHRQLTIASKSPLIVSFVLLAEQQDVIHAFTERLNMIESTDDAPINLSFDKHTVKITLTGSNKTTLLECQNEIVRLAQSQSLKLHLTDKIDMADWSQDTVKKFYEFCLKKQVIPTLDIEKSIIDLVGSKDAVHEAEKYFFQLTAETLREARIHVVSRGFIWSVEVSPGKWEQYSFKTNGQIEDAYLKKLPHIDFKNDKSEQCRLILSSLEEQYQKRKRKVCRKRIDSILPNNWDLSGEHIKQVILSNISKEYNDVMNQFNVTMQGSYRYIVKIERIQNERWYKQYAAHRDDFTQRYTQPDERLLFHGCTDISASKIVQECFNRSFAGVTGVLYGCGVYFHAHAKYSHSYTRENSSGERTMFLTRVLIGKTCHGNPSMKVPPKDFDTTTDGSHIFVVYHDAGAYAEYLITYV